MEPDEVNILLFTIKMSVISYGVCKKVKKIDYDPPSLGS